MFQIVCDSSSESTKFYLSKIRSGSLMFVVCIIGVWQCNFWISGVCVCVHVCVCVCVCVCVWYDGLRTGLKFKLLPRPSYRTHTPLVQKLRCQTPIKHTTNISEPLRIISVKYSFILPDDGSHTIRNTSVWSLILCLLKIFIQRRF